MKGFRPEHFIKEFQPGDNPFEVTIVRLIDPQAVDIRTLDKPLLLKLHTRIKMREFSPAHRKAFDTLVKGIGIREMFCGIFTPEISEIYEEGDVLIADLTSYLKPGMEAKIVHLYEVARESPLVHADRIPPKEMLDRAITQLFIRNLMKGRSFGDALDKAMEPEMAKKEVKRLKEEMEEAEEEPPPPPPPPPPLPVERVEEAEESAFDRTIEDKISKMEEAASAKKKKGKKSKKKKASKKKKKVEPVVEEARTETTPPPGPIVEVPEPGPVVEVPEDAPTTVEPPPIAEPVEDEGERAPKAEMVAEPPPKAEEGKVEEVAEEAGTSDTMMADPPPLAVAEEVKEEEGEAAPAAFEVPEEGPPEPVEAERPEGQLGDIMSRLKSFDFQKKKGKPEQPAPPQEGPPAQEKVEGEGDGEGEERGEGEGEGDKGVVEEPGPPKEEGQPTDGHKDAGGGTAEAEAGASSLELLMKKLKGGPGSKK